MFGPHVAQVDEAIGSNPWFEYLRTVKDVVRERLAAGDDPMTIRRSFRDRICDNGQGRPSPLHDRLRAVASLALNAVLPPEEREARPFLAIGGEPRPEIAASLARKHRSRSIPDERGG